ncbi:hypothetical protein AGMMS49944_32210 [Spirochaetia bacterium]|nr:hypothetical protein AGMMS49944_32210 [Spirochaetia bacterium]
MDLTDKVLERAREKAKESGHGSVEIIFDEGKPFVDVVLHDRERIETTEVLRKPPHRTIPR